MRLGCFQSCACVSSCYTFAKQALAMTICELDEIRRDPEAFQKICIVARSIIQGMNLYFHTNHLSGLVNVLNVTESFDFYGFCRLPRYLMHPYLPDRLDEYAILDQLETILCQNWHMGSPDEKGQLRDAKVQEFAKTQLNAFLEGMVDNDQDLRSEEEVKALLHNWLTQTLQSNPDNSKKGFDSDYLNLKDLKIPFKPTTWLEFLTDMTFIGIDIACVPAFLSDWSLLDLSYYANKLGRISFLKWVPNQCLDDCVWRAMSVGYTLQFIQAFRNLWQGELTADEVKDAKWQMAASIAECVYSRVMIQTKDMRLIVFCALVAKSLGLLRFILAPKPTFFTASHATV